MDARQKVQATFEKWIPDEDGCLARDDFMDMLKMLGLRRIDAEELMSVLDPKVRTRFPYKEFLDFIFGPLEQSSQADSTKAETSEQVPLENAGVDDDISPNDLNGKKDEPPGDDISETTTKLASSQALSSENAETMTPEQVSPTPDAGTPTHDGSEAASPADTAMETTVNQCSQCLVRGTVFKDPNDLEFYCERCWLEYYGKSPQETTDLSGLPAKLVNVFPGKVWKQADLSRRWMQVPIAGWPPYASPTPAVSAAAPVACPPSGDPKDIPNNPGQCWMDVRVRVIPTLVGPHARECTRQDRPYLREVLNGRYQVDGVCGAGHFTRAFRCTDLVNRIPVCVKRHNSLTIEILTDLLAIGKRLESVDPESAFFPRLVDCFFDMSGYTVEAIIEGKNCLDVGRENPCHFQKMSNLRHVAKGSLKGLELLSLAGVVHCDLKPDNIMWTHLAEIGGDPVVRIVDFGCARLDSRNEQGRNWSLSEGGAGHLGKWAPEMALRLPITEKADVWGLAVSLLELYSGRAMWSNEDDTIEVVLAQALGLLNAKAGLPPELLRRSPIDITRLYTPAPAYFPCRRIGDSSDSPLEEIKPAVWGLGQVLGAPATWDEVKTNLSDFVQRAMEMDPERRPKAETLLKHAFIVGGPPAQKPKQQIFGDSDYDTLL